jgi:hypothetical protein
MYRNILVLLIELGFLGISMQEKQKLLEWIRTGRPEFKLTGTCGAIQRIIAHMRFPWVEGEHPEYRLACESMWTVPGELQEIDDIVREDASLTLHQLLDKYALPRGEHKNFKIKQVRYDQDGMPYAVIRKKGKEVML